MTSCKKECMIDFVDGNSFIFYDRFSCITEISNGNYQVKFNSMEDFNNSQNCFVSGGIIPFPLDFNGLILAQGVKVEYLGQNQGQQGYELSTILMVDSCNKIVDFNFLLYTVDTTRNIEHRRNVIVLLEGIDSTYTVNFKHEIIPYRE